jgi:glycosyltransferase involved in cell wall biosynthesis
MTAPPLTIGIAFPGSALARDTWSGTPAGLAQGFADLGFMVQRLDARAARAVDAVTFSAVTLAHARPTAGGMGAALRRARAVARVSPLVAAVRERALIARLGDDAPLDAIVQIGTGYAVPPGPPVATYEDMTIPQAIALRQPGWDGLSPRAVRVCRERQLRSYDRATVCCLSTAWAAASVRDDYAIDPAKVHAVGIGRNHDPAPASRDWAVPRFLFVGIDWLGKNGPRLLDAFARVREEHPRAQLDIVGGHPPLDAPGVTGHGRLRMDDPGDRSLLQGLYEQATCFVLPSLREPAGIVYIEAMAAGVPAIGTTAGGAGDLIGAAGCVVAPEDEDALVAAMRRFAVSDVAQAYSVIAQERARLFTWRAVAHRIASALGLPVAADLPDTTTSETALFARSVPGR